MKNPQCLLQLDNQYQLLVLTTYPYQLPVGKTIRHILY